MSVEQTYLERTFLVESGDARIRLQNDLLQFDRYGASDPLPPGCRVGDFKTIAKDMQIGIGDVRVLPGDMIFARAHRADAPGTVFGWTSSQNLQGKFVNETLGALLSASNDPHGDNAAWQKGEYLGQWTLVQIVGIDLKVKRLARDTAEAYLGLVADARSAGVQVALSSGFRSYAEQRYLYDGFMAGKHGFNTAAAPGFSNHQNGHAFDIALAGFDGDRVYDWLKANGPAHGFIRTVEGEPWHWEYQPTLASELFAKGRFKADGVSH